jgi:transcriptional regulator
MHGGGRRRLTPYMYIPAQFNGSELADAVALMKAHPFATLITDDDEGWPYLTHLPLHLETRPSDNEVPILVLLGHVAKANPHWRYLRDRGNATVSFLGPHAYMSPSVYPDLTRVPTWNYLAVACRVEAALIEGNESADGMMVKMIEDYEPAYLKQWRSLDELYVSTMLSSIVAFELKVTQVQCKLKLNQHRPESHAAMRAAYGNGNENERELLRWMDKLNLK